MSNSSLVSYTLISPNKTSPRNSKIDTITIHCVVGQLSAKSIGGVFAPTSRKASSNYGIGTDGEVGMYVEEKDRSWCTSSGTNDHRAITIECASDKAHPYAVNSKVYNTLIKLCVDICKRNNIKELRWKADPSLIGIPSKQNMTVHRWFSNTACPGDYLFNRMGEIAKVVNKSLGGSFTNKPETGNGLYRVQVGAFREKKYAEDMLKKITKAGFDAFISHTVDTNTPAYKPPTKTIDEIAREVIAGKWGNGGDRKAAIKNAGYDYEAVRLRVNQLMSSRVTGVSAYVNNSIK